MALSKRELHAPTYRRIASLLRSYPRFEQGDAKFVRHLGRYSTMAVADRSGRIATTIEACEPRE